MLEFIYKVDFPNGLTEHEYLHVFIGHYDGDPALNLEEADDFQWIGLDTLQKDIARNPEKYTYWFRLALEKLIAQKLIGQGSAKE